MSGRAGPPPADEAGHPASRVPPPLRGRRDPGDAWVTAPTGERYWGAFGAAGVLAVDPQRGVLLQHRALWSHHGGTWGLPGGALHAGESALDGALREAHEEAGLAPHWLSAHATLVVDRQVWRYTTLIARADPTTRAAPGDQESLELRWVAIPSVDALELHPGFGAAWPRLRKMAQTRAAVVVDVANVMGARPDGWWRDRTGAATRLLASLTALATRGIEAGQLELGGDHWWPRIEAVVEGQARSAASPPGISVIAAPASGDDAIVAAVRQRRSRDEQVVVVTSDRALAARVTALGARPRGARWLLDQLEGG